MMVLSGRVRIARRFLRSIRIDTDLSDPQALSGFVCPQSSADVLVAMARHIRETGQAAFTWTGPYGSGKSSLAIALSAFVSDDPSSRRQAARSMGRPAANALRKAMPPGDGGWHVVPVVGTRADPVDCIGDALLAAGLVTRRPRGGWSERKIVDVLSNSARKGADGRGGVLLLVDEMGKFLESAAHDGTDIYLFQQLAEAASRSDGRFVFVGILHQAFEEYAFRLSREMRDEWAKIQGRFIDLAVNTAGEEQIDLLTRAIESDHAPGKPSKACVTVAGLAHRQRSADADRLAGMLESCWPLHPVVAYLLGPISRRRFGQNQRSIFGFLNSAELYGFQDFLRDAEDGALYMPDRLWDYLRANLEPSILASPDGHRWALVAEALERCEAIGGNALHLRLLKTIGLIDLFKERAALLPGFELLKACFPAVTAKELQATLDDLNRWSFTTFRKFSDSHAIFAGSDFDIDAALRTALEDVRAVRFKDLQRLAGLHPVLAKRHYHETGTLRWFDVRLAPACDLAEIAAQYNPAAGTIGQFVLALPTEGESEETLRLRCREAARASDAWDTIAGFSGRSFAIVDLALELQAIEDVRSTRAELAGDSVARREIEARRAAIQAHLETALQRTLDSAIWFRKHHQPKAYSYEALNGLASELAELRFDSCPKLHNELLNRQKPSSSAIAAQNGLLRRMVLNEGEPRLGIDGYPAEGGLFASLLEATGLYAETRNGRWHFGTPAEGDECRLAPLWSAALTYVKANGDRTIAISEIYDLWRAPPFGVKDGLLPILAVAFVLSQRAKLAVYRDGIFRSQFDDVDVDYLAKDPQFIQLRWMDLSKLSRKLLSGMAQIVRDLDSKNTLEHLEPIDVARGLVSVYDQLPRWTTRTMRLSANAVHIRDLFKRSNDPNKVLFDDIPTVAGINGALRTEAELERVISGVGDGLAELVQAYPAMLHRLRDMMLSELQVPNLSRQALSELRERAANIRALSGDFRMEAFVGRLSQFDGSDTAFEAIASLAADKPPRDWVDPDLDRATLNIAELAQNFLRAETFARVKGRTEKRHAMAVVVGLHGSPAPLLEEFDVADTDREAVDALIERVTAALDGADTSRRRIILAALAELSARYMEARPATETEPARAAAHHE